MKRIISIFLALLLSLSMVSCNRKDKNAGFTESELAQINAAQDAIQTGEIPLSWLHPEGSELTYENILYKVNSLNIVEELPENLAKILAENDPDIHLNKFEHFLILNITMKNASDSEIERLLEMRIEMINDGHRFDSLDFDLVFDKSQHPYGNNYGRYTFQPNEEVTANLVYIAHERRLEHDIYFTPSTYSCSYVKVMDAPFKREPRKENANIEIWEKIFDEYMPDNNAPLPLPKPEQGTLKKSDIVSSKDDVIFVVKNMEYDYAMQYFSDLIFEGFNSTPYYIDKNMTDFYEPKIDEDAGTVSILFTFGGRVYDIVYTKSTKEMKIHICTLSKAVKEALKK